MLEHWLVQGLPSEETAVEILSMTPRTLRRRLAQESTSWRRVLNDLKFSTAVARLKHARCSVGEIAAELGYSDTAQFTRFFRQRAGLPPSAYREWMARWVHRKIELRSRVGSDNAFCPIGAS